jgi:hypothetical protein
MRVRRSIAGLTAAVLTTAGLISASPVAAHGGNSWDELGRFGEPFSEQSIGHHRTKERCITDHHGNKVCKPAAGAMAILANGRILYWNALEGTENVKNGVAAEFGKVSVNDQTRVLRLSRRKWSQPRAVDGGANPNGYETEPLIEPLSSTETYNDGALFCTDLAQLPDGRILAAGGTAYYNDPGQDALSYGVVELEGLRNTRAYNPRTNKWRQVGSMQHGRWYPTLVTLGNGKVFVAGGVQKLIKPVYPSHMMDSGSNVKQTETFDPRTNKWTYNGTSADASLPLYPRLHLLPNGHIFYNAAGQAFNPAGQSYDEVLWNLTSSYDPKAKEWTNLGVPGIGTTSPGFRGSGFSAMLPLRPNKSGGYTKAEFLSAGGVLGVTPGSYLATATSLITSVAVAGGQETMTSRATGSFTHARWYSTGAVLPTGQVIAFSGADRDEVVGPGSGFPVTQAELFDPKTELWKPVATAHHARTYHNTAALLPDGRVLVGGHAPIPTGYGSHTTLPGGFSPNEGRDPTFEIYSPPYMFQGPRPVITDVDRRLRYGDRFTIELARKTNVHSVVLVRNPSITHLVDADQRVVELQVARRRGNKLTVKGPANGNVVPPGPYMLFVNRAGNHGPVPSESVQVFVR